ncbi:plasmid recombination protein [Endozoicomonas sp. SM1973]|uniref:Plasmid recombination protein n=1 Tax=Spartinivicinus marinus TaxID=2994442 RepID=A0A853IIB0_9GAMM|nr:MobV family relaxase [Spartinivicinus marinus]NYZ69764.1 plasmid recombination protein [Spartinivicinus marinus]
MSYTILRTAKLKSMGEIGGSLSHTFRDRETLNADPSRTPLNELHGHSTATEAREAIRQLLPEKRRKDAVLCIEYFIGASPQFFEKDDLINTNDMSFASSGDYFSQARKWLEERHGKENVVFSAIHRDERSPHLVAYVVPLDENGKLNAKKWLGGRAKLSAMQTDFHKKVGQQFGLERGIEGSKAKHTTIKQFYGALENETPKQGVLKKEALEKKTVKKGFLGVFPDELETDEDRADRITNTIQRYYAPALLQASTAALDRRRADEMEKTAKDKSIQLEAAQRAVKSLSRRFTEGLTDHQQMELEEMANQIRHENQIFMEQKKRLEHLPKLLKQAAGAVYIFAQKATEEIKRVGHWQKVNWNEVEKETIKTAITESRQSKESTIEAISKHSPAEGHIKSPENTRFQLEIIANHFAEKLEISIKEQKNTPKPSRGPRM